LDDEEKEEGRGGAERWCEEDDCDAEVKELNLFEREAWRLKREGKASGSATSREDLSAWMAITCEVVDGKI
jgi:hypothetical protein